MIRISLEWIIESFGAIDALARLESGQTGVEAWSPLFKAQQHLEQIFNNSVYKPYLKISLEKATLLHETISELIQALTEDHKYELNEAQVWRINNQKNHFRMLFLSELHAMPAYLVTPKDNFDIDRLINSGNGLFPASLMDKVMEAKQDAMEAGSCLAYERNTACGFHTFRVVEAVLRRYWDVISAGKKKPHPETLGNIAAQLSEAKLGDEKVIEAHKQLSKLHRNPIAHPDVVLTADEAIATIGMAHSVITHMLRALPEELPTTGASTVEE